MNKRILAALILPAAAVGVMALSACHNEDEPAPGPTTTAYVPVPSASTTTEVVPVPSASKSVEVVPSASVSVSVSASPDDDGE